jgi:protoporphyrinogen oxidase
MWGRFEQRRGARTGRGERLGYLRGGFRQLFDALAGRLEQLGVEVRTDTKVAAVNLDGDRVTGVTAAGADIASDAVLYTGALPGITRLLPDDRLDQRWREAQGLGVLCSVIETDRPITDVYWTNVCDDRLGFGGIIEHTNLVPAADYAGRHVTYLSRYFTADEPIAGADPASQTDTWLAQLAAAYPRFDPSSVLDVHPFRTPYAAPLVSLGYRNRIPPLRADGLAGLYVCTTAQIYPQDRGMSEGVRMGSDAASAILADASAARP